MSCYLFFSTKNKNIKQMYKNSDMEDGNKQKANKDEQTSAIPETRN